MLSLLQQVRLLDPVANTDQIADVLIEDGVIRAIAPHLSEVPAEAQVRSCQGLVLAPGLVDLYSHSGEPGFEERETLDSLMQAAIAGGFTRINLLPDTHPAIDNPTTVAWIASKVGSAPHLSCWAALTVDTQAQHMTELRDLANAGITGFSDGKPITNFSLLRRLLEYCQPLQKPIALWAWEPELAGMGVAREGVNALRFGLSGVPAIAETAPLAALLECVAEIGTPVHLMRISTARSVELIRLAKARAVPITASTTWMHLLLDTDALARYDPQLRLDPPLGNSVDRAAIAQAVKDGVIDAIAVDHSPYTYEEKTVSFGEAPAGAIGLELALPLLWQAFVATGQWSALELWRALSSRPLECLGQKPSALHPLAKPAPSPAAELVLFDPDQTWVTKPQSLKSLSDNTVWLNKTLTGRVLQVWT
ncbi:dihydroorotase [Myxacorys almedinensis]|uniref:Dihydroorotase n=1 Tax=Myxacorys almedinensis A TaxID=2690445 RepID=A0A8J7ZB02_9CYAN|nr:dihydroorotase [Myxacorys almedinensis]NDJ19633.1 dihydroorotase [Myxacorys almedinensis A]